MSSLKSTPRRIVTNFFFGLNAACKPPRRPHSNTPPASLPFPSRPEGAEAPSPGHSPWVFMSARLAPCRGKSFIWRPNLRLCSSLHPRTGYRVLSHVPKTYHFGISDKRIYICALNKTYMDKSIHSHLYHQIIGRLRSKRESKSVTQVQLAEMLGVKQTFISKIETCDRRLDLIELRQICQVLNISFVDFVAEVERDILSKGKCE